MTITTHDIENTSQAGLIEKHMETVDWLSSLFLWKGELQNFRKMLGETSMVPATKTGRIDADHFQLMILHQLSEIEKLRSRLLNHETTLNNRLDASSGSINLEGTEEHEHVMSLLESFSRNYRQFRKEFFQFTLKAAS